MRSCFYSKFPFCPLRFGRSAPILLLFILYRGYFGLSKPRRLKRSQRKGFSQARGRAKSLSRHERRYLRWDFAKWLAGARCSTTAKGWAAAAHPSAETLLFGAGAARGAALPAEQWPPPPAAGGSSGRVVHQPSFSLTPLIPGQRTRGMLQSSYTWKIAFSPR